MALWRPCPVAERGQACARPGSLHAVVGLEPTATAKLPFWFLAGPWLLLQVLLFPVAAVLARGSWALE